MNNRTRAATVAGTGPLDQRQSRQGQHRPPLPGSGTDARRASNWASNWAANTPPSKFADFAASREQPDKAMDAWLESLAVKMQRRLATWGLMNNARATGAGDGNGRQGRFY